LLLLRRPPISTLFPYTTLFRSHVFRNTLIIFILFIIGGSSVYGMTRYNGVKKAIDSSYHESGLKKQRNVGNQLQNKRPISILLRSEEHTSELQSRFDLVCRLLL